MRRRNPKTRSTMRLRSGAKRKGEVEEKIQREIKIERKLGETDEEYVKRKKSVARKQANNWKRLVSKEVQEFEYGEEELNSNDTQLKKLYKRWKAFYYPYRRKESKDMCLKRFEIFKEYARFSYRYNKDISECKRVLHKYADRLQNERIGGRCFLSSKDKDRDSDRDIGDPSYIPPKCFAKVEPNEMSKGRKSDEKQQQDLTGLEKQVLKAGTGPKPTVGQYVTVHCTGFGKNGDLTKKFYSNKGKVPLTFKIGEGSVIEAWEEGVQDMQLREVARIKCSSDYAYGPGGFPIWGILPNSVLVFEVEVLSII